MPRDLTIQDGIYDRASRLLSEDRSGGFKFNYSKDYAYDKNGNRTNHQVDNNDKLLSGDGFTFSSYSADGNPGSAYVPGTGSVSFAYDYENRMKQIVLPSRTNTFKYNADGQRVEQISSGGTDRYVYDGWNIIAQTDGSGNILVYHLPGVGFIDAGTQYYYRENALGSTVAVSNASGGVYSQTEYDAYGFEYAILWPNPGIQSQFRFGGKHGYQTDEDTGMDLLGHRYYMPKLGRFLTQDPIGHEAGLNLYSYCANNPVTKVDPDGKQFFGFWKSPEEVFRDSSKGGALGLSIGLSRYSATDINGMVKFGRNIRPNGFVVDRTFHFDGPHKGVSYWHFNADVGPLSRFDHVQINPKIRFLGSEGFLRVASRVGLVGGLALDIYDVATAAPGQRAQAVGGAVGSWAMAGAGAAWGSAIWPGPGTVIGAIGGAVAGSRFGRWVVSWFE